ncbi:MAG TPA: UDP-N-acetylmuramate dehydrogenase [Patescibacteria group bacterium]
MPNMKSIDNKIVKNKSLAQFTNYKIGGPARYFLAVKKDQDLVEAIKWAKENKIEYFILGGGTNILISDDGYAGLVLKLENKDFTIKDNVIKTGAGAILFDLVKASVAQGLTGFEWASGLPGTVGGAVRGNAGAFGGQMDQIVTNAKAFDCQTLKFNEYNNKQLQFSYRHSRFKEEVNQEIVLSVEIKLKKGGDKKKSQMMIAEYLEKRGKLPILPSAGCIFKNVELKKGTFQLADPGQGEIKETVKKDIRRDHPEYLEWGKIPAAFLIEYVGLKGKQINNVQVSDKHANYLVNLGGGRAADVIMLISLIKQKVRSEAGIQLKEEVQLVGF